MNIPAIARKAAAAAFAVAGSVLTAATLKLNPTDGAYDSATDTTAITTTDVADRFLFWDPEEQGNGDKPEKQSKMMMVRDAQLPGGATITQEATVTMGGETWNVNLVVTDPAGAIHILTLSR